MTEKGGSHRKAASGVVLVLLVEFAVLLLGLVALRLAATMGTDAFAEYAIGRRALQVLAFPVLMGVGVAIPRYVAADLSPTADRARVLLGAGLMIVLPVMAFAAIALIVAGDRFQSLLFGPESGASMTFPVTLGVAGLCLHVLAYAYFRGLMRWRSTAVLQVVGVGLVPIVALLGARGTPERAVLLTGVGWIAVSGAVLLGVLRGGHMSPAELRPAVTQLLRFGVPRVPGELALFALFAVPVFLVANTQGLAAAGYLSLGLSVLSLATSMYSSLGVVLLPYVSRLAAAGNERGAQSVVARTLAGGVMLAAVVALVSVPLVPYATQRYLGGGFLEAVETVRVLLWATVPYVVYAILRNPLDALRAWPHNSVNLVLAVLVISALIWWGERVVTPAQAVFAGLLLLAGGSLVSWWRTGPVVRAPMPLKTGEAPSW